MILTAYYFFSFPKISHFLPPTHFAQRSKASQYKEKDNPVECEPSCKIIIPFRLTKVAQRNRTGTSERNGTTYTTAYSGSSAGNNAKNKNLPNSETNLSITTNNKQKLFIYLALNKRD